MFIKICSKCKKGKPTSEFNKNKTMKDGYQNQCRDCQKNSDKSKGKLSKEQAEKFVDTLVKEGKVFTCKCCGKTKTADKFYHQRKRGSVKIVDSKCKECQKDYQRAKTFGVSVDDYSKMLSEQEGKCAICGINHEEYQKVSHRNKKFAVDHCHTTGKIRGLLCDKCNRGIGFLQDSEQNLINAIKYLRLG